MIAYLDASLVVSLYAIDANSEAAALALSSCSELPIITTLCQIEVINTFGLQVYRKEVSPERTNFSIESFDEDLRSGVYRLMPLPEATFARARQVSLRHTPEIGIRTADLLHIAAALELGADKLLSFDALQRKLASAVGLSMNLL